MPYDFTACKKLLAKVNKNTSRLNSHSFAHCSCLLPEGSAGRIARKFWCINQEFSSVYIIIPPWFSMLMYHLRDEQW
jgi:hypothetical protein